MRFGVDLDGTVFELMGEEVYDPCKFGGVRPGAKEVLNALVKAGHEVYIYSCRTNPDHPKHESYMIEELKVLIIEELNLRGISFTKISVYKPFCDYYIDDRNLIFTTWLDFGNSLRRLGIL